MQKISLKKALPHTVAVLIFLILGLVYFYPQLQGNALKQGDYDKYIGMSKEVSDFQERDNVDPLWTGSMFSGMPAYQINVQSKQNLFKYFESKLLSIIKSPASLLFLSMLGFYLMLLCFKVDPWLSIIGGIAYGFASIGIIYIGAGHLTKVHAIALLPPVVGGVVYTYRYDMIKGAAITALFLCLQLSANHLQETYYLIYLLLAIAAVELVTHFMAGQLVKFVKASSLLIIAVLLAVLPFLSVLLSTYQYSAYTMRGKSELTIKKSGDEEKMTSGLDMDYIKQYSIGYGEVWSLVAPNVKGGVSGYIGNDEDVMKKVDRRYKEAIAQSMSFWGEQNFSGGAFYFGASIFLLFILGMIFIKDPLKWAVLAVTVLSIILSWKYSNMLDFFINHVPLFNKFRDTKMMLVLVQIAFPLMGLLFVKQLMKRELQQKKLLIAVGAVIGLFLLLYAAPESFFDFTNKQEQAGFESQIAEIQKTNPGAMAQFDEYQEELTRARISIYRSDILRAILFIVLTGGFVFLYAKGIIKSKLAFLVVLGAIVLIDLWSVDKRYLNNEKTKTKFNSWVSRYEKKNPFRASTADLEILKSETAANKELITSAEKAAQEYVKENSIKGKYKELEKEKILFRELNLATNYRVLNLNNPFNDSETSYYHKSIGGYHGAKLKKYQELIDFRISVELSKIISTFNSQQGGDAIYSMLQNNMPTLNMLNTKYIIYNPGAAPLKNPFANGNCWFVRNLVPAETADDEILALDTLNTKQAAVINKKYLSEAGGKTSYSGKGNVVHKEYRPNFLSYDFDSEDEQFVVFSEIYYKDGWNAYIDGAAIAHYPVNYTLRGLHVPAGKHLIEFKFEPSLYYAGQKVSLAGSILLLLVLGAVLYLNFRKTKNTDAITEE